MDTIMHKSRKRPMGRNLRASSVAACTVAALAAPAALAGDVTLQPSVSSSVIFQQIDSEGRGDRDILTWRVDPGLRALYTAKRAQASVNLSGTHLQRDNDTFARQDTYIEYDYAASLEVIERLLQLSAQGRSNYLNTNTNNFLVSDFLTNADDLARTQTDTVRALTDFSQNPFVSGTASVSFSKVQAEESRFINTERLNNETISLATQFTDGSAIQGFKWQFSGNYSDTDRSQANLGNFTSHEVSAFVDRHVFDQLAVRVTGYSESYEFRSQGDFIQNEREFDSVGAGLTYRVSDDRYIALTANTANSSNPDNDGDVYPGVDISWAFTNRTSLQANFGQRFFGNSANVRLQHATRKIRTILSYSEQVRNFSQFINDNQTDGVFVCPGVGFSPGCFQAPSLGYQLQNGEQFVQFSDNNNDIADNVILRKGGALEMSYESRVTTLGVFARYSEDDFLGQGRQRETISYGTNLNYRIGAFTRLNAVLSFADIDQSGNRFGAGQFANGQGDNTALSLSLSHRLSPHLNATAGYTFNERSGDIRDNAFGSNFTENRFQVGLTYQFR